MFGIGYVNKEIKPCTKALFLEKVQSKVVEDTVNMIDRLYTIKAENPNRKEWADKNIAQAKRSLPVITPMAYFKDNKRKVENAIPSGLNMIDVDHVANALEMWGQISKKQLPYKVALVHITPSGRGLRIIFRQPEALSIAEAQAELAKACGVVHDEVTKDLARCSFLVPEKYLLYVDYNVLFANIEPSEQKLTQSEEQNENKQEQTQAEASQPQAETTTSKDFPKEYKNIPYEEIIKLLLFSMSYDETPTEGERNQALYGLARNLRYICDYNVERIMSILPDWGLPESEVRATVTSAVNSVRKETMPKQLAQIIKNLSNQYLSLGEQYTADWDYVVSEGGIIGEFVKIQPRYLKNACYLAAMTCFATLLTRLRGRGMNGDKIAPNFMVTISAPQATGKSFMTKVFEHICSPIKKEDDRQRKIKKDIEKENKRNAEKEDYEEKEFEGAIRLLPTNTSNRVLIERMDKAKSQHLMICAEEIDSITKSEKAGKWSEKSDVYRLAYDNSFWGQDYASDNSYNAVVRLYLNLLFSGTPAAVSRFFSDIENGLITRFLFCDLPDTFGQKRPQRVKMDADTKKQIDAKLTALFEQMNTTSNEDNEIWIDTSKMVEDVSNLYDEPQRRMYLVNQFDPSRDLARRRYADYAVKMMMIETYLNDGVYTEEIRDRVIGIMNYCTEQLLALHGDAINKSLNESVEKHEVAKKRSKKKDLLESLPSRFTSAEFEEVAINFGYNKTTIRPMLNRLCIGGLLENTDRGMYAKRES